MTSPLRQMTAAVREMAAGRPVPPVRATSRDEVGELARAFTAMARDLLTADEQRTDLMANVGHELRTPVAAVRAQLENLVDGVRPADPRPWPSCSTRSNGSVNWSTTCSTWPGPRPGWRRWSVARSGSEPLVRDIVGQVTTVRPGRTVTVDVPAGLRARRRPGTAASGPGQPRGQRRPALPRRAAGSTSGAGRRRRRSRPGGDRRRTGDPPRGVGLRLRTVPPRRQVPAWTAGPVWVWPSPAGRSPCTAVESPSSRRHAGAGSARFCRPHHQAPDRSRPPHPDPANLKPDPANLKPDPANLKPDPARPPREITCAHHRPARHRHRHRHRPSSPVRRHRRQPCRCDKVAFPGGRRHRDRRRRFSWPPSPSSRWSPPAPGPSRDQACRWWPWRPG